MRPSQKTRPAPGPRQARIGDNGGPPLEEPKRRRPRQPKSESIGRFFDWRTASRRAWRPRSRDIALERQRKAEKLGLSYEEYTLEILERGYFPQEEHVAAIKAKRAERRADGGIVGQSLKGRRLR